MRYNRNHITGDIEGYVAPVVPQNASIDIYKCLQTGVIPSNVRVVQTPANNLELHNIEGRSFDIFDDIEAMSKNYEGSVKIAEKTTE